MHRQKDSNDCRISGVDILLQGTERIDLFTHERGNTGWNEGQWGMQQVSSAGRLGFGSR